MSRHTGSAEKDWLDGGFTLPRNGAKGSKTLGAGFVRSGGVISEVDVGMPFVPCASMTPSCFNLASDPGSFGNLDPEKSRFVLSVMGVDRPYNTSIGKRSRKTSKRSGIFSKELGLVQRSEFGLAKRACIFAKIFSILAE